MVTFTAAFLAGKIARKGWTVGEGTYGVPTVLEWGTDGLLHIGKYCSLAGGIRIMLGGNHRTDWVTTYPFMAFDAAASHIKGHPATKGDVVIGSDVWIGAEVKILSGVTIGHGACIATGAVVSRDIPPYVIAGGNPAKPLRQRFSDDQIKSLLAIAWWDWPPERIRQHYALIMSPDVDAFIQAAMGNQGAEAAVAAPDAEPEATTP